MSQNPELTSAAIGLEIAFDVTNPKVQEFIKTHSYKFAKAIEDYGQDRIRQIIGDALREGATIPEIIKRLRDEFADWSKYRAEEVSRTETSRAANAGSVQAYAQAGIKRKDGMLIPEPVCFARILTARL